MDRIHLLALFAAICLVLCAGSDEQSTGAISGVVRFTGTVPAPKVITTSDGGTIRHSDLIVDEKTKGLRFVVAVLEDAPPQPKLKEAKPALMDQRDWVFTPRVIAVQHGQPVRFDNSDLFNHNVNAASTLKANQFNINVTPGQPMEHVFESQKPPVMIGCSLHPWMRGWVYVLPHPWFAVTDTKGSFRIEKVLPGKYTLLLTHQDTLLRERRTVQVEAGKTVEVSVEWQKLPEGGK